MKRTQNSGWQIFSFQLPLVSGSSRQGLVVRLMDENGEEKWGEIAPYPGRSQETLAQGLEQLCKVLSTGRIEEELFPSVQFGLESALIFPPSVLKLPTYAFLHGMPNQILQQAEVAHAQGYKIAKVKIGSMDGAVELFNALTDRFRLRIDCNRAFSFKDAVTLFSGLDSNLYDYIEDPTYEIARLPDFPFPFALDEVVMDYRSLPLHTYRQLYGLILKPTLLGGYKGCAPMIDFAKKNHLKIVFSPTFESGLGLLQIAHLAHRFQLSEDPVGLDTHRFLKQDLLMTNIFFNFPQFVLSEPPKVNQQMLKELAHGKCALPNLRKCLSPSAS